MRWTEEQYQALLARNPTAPVRPLPPGNRRKYGNTPTPMDGRLFASKREAKRYQDLVLLKASGAIRGFACQVSIPLPSGKRRMVIDFMITEVSGEIRWEDAKGYATKDWLVKKDELESSLGIRIELV